MIIVIVIVIVIVVTVVVEFEWVALMVMSPFLLTAITEFITAFAYYTVAAYVLLYYSIAFYALFVPVEGFDFLFLYTPVCAWRISINMRG